MDIYCSYYPFVYHAHYDNFSGKMRNNRDPHSAAMHSWAGDSRMTVTVNHIRDVKGPSAGTAANNGPTSRSMPPISRNTLPDNDSSDAP